MKKFYEKSKNWMSETSKKSKNWMSETSSKFSSSIVKSKSKLLEIPAFAFAGRYLKIATKHFNKYSMFYVLGLLFVIFTLTGTNLFNPDRFSIILFNNSYIFIIGLGMLLVIISGNIDLSVGRLLGLTSLFAGYIFTVVSPGNLFVAILLTLLLGIALGIIQGFMIGYLKIPAFIITLGGMLVFQGLELQLAGLAPNGNSFSLTNTALSQFSLLQFPDINLASGGSSFWIAAFLIISLVGVLLVILSVLKRIQAKKYEFQNENILIFVFKQIVIMGLFIGLATFISLSSRGLQLYMLYILILIVIFVIITKYTKFGRSVYAIGGNKKAAELSGINSKRTTMNIFIIIGLVSAFAGIVYAGTQEAVRAGATSGFELNVISAVFIGGASVSGGIGTVVGTVTGAFILGVINLGTITQPAATKAIITGLVLVAAVTYDVISKRKIT